jgi:hypothetical protein
MVDTIEEFIFVDEYDEALPPEMNTEAPTAHAWRAGDHTHRYDLGISSGSSSSSSRASSSAVYTGSDPLCASYFNTQYIEDVMYLLKLIIELYELNEIKPLYERMGNDWLANKSMYRHRYVGVPPEKPKEKHLDDELFKI